MRIAPVPFLSAAALAPLLVVGPAALISAGLYTTGISPTLGYLLTTFMSAFIVVGLLPYLMVLLPAFALVVRRSDERTPLTFALISVLATLAMALPIYVILRMSGALAPATGMWLITGPGIVLYPLIGMVFGVLYRRFAGSPIPR